MENEELKNKLIGKLEKELAEFKDSLMELSSKEIIDSSYKITCMETIQDYLAYDKDYSKFELKTLLKREHSSTNFANKMCYIKIGKYKKKAKYHRKP